LFKGRFALADDPDEDAAQGREGAEGAQQAILQRSAAGAAEKKLPDQVMHRKSPEHVFCSLGTSMNSHGESAVKRRECKRVFRQAFDGYVCDIFGQFY
jgi:hypothetical protein